MVNLKSSRSEIKLFLKFTKKKHHLNNYFETVSPIILAALWTMSILWTILVLLQTIVIINIKRSLESLCTNDDFDFTNFIFTRVMESSTEGTSHCCFCNAVSNNCFQFFLLINFISTYSNWLKNCSFTHFLLTKGYGKYSVRKESLNAPFVEWFKRARASSS